MSKSACFTGHRPQGLYGYNLKDEKYMKLHRVLYDYLEEMVRDYNYDKFYTGGALGLDTLAFFTVNKLKKKYPNIKNILAIPFYNQPNNWFNKEDVERYNKMKELADGIIYVDTLDKYKIKGYEEGKYYSPKMQKRNEFMVDNSDTVISVWNGIRKGGTHNCIQYAQNKEKTVVNIYPKSLEISVLL